MRSQANRDWRTKCGEAITIEMAGFVQGVDRDQVILLPARLEEYVAEDNPVRAVDGLELEKLGLVHAQPLDIGRRPRGLEMMSPAVTR
jgi:hypothetical protein